MGPGSVKQHRGRSSGNNWDTTDTEIQLESFTQNLGFGNGGKGNSYKQTDSDASDGLPDSLTLSPLKSSLKVGRSQRSLIHETTALIIYS